MVSPAVSIIIPTYNRRRSLLRAARSALRQTVTKEIVIIDDGSTDNTTDLLKKLSQKHKEIRFIINEKNIGSGASRNLGIQKAKGEFIAFLDSDDIYPDKTSLQRMYDLCIKNNVSICGSLRELKIFRKKIKTDDFRKECLEHPEGPVLDYREYQQDYDFSSYIFRRELLLQNNIQFPEYRRYQDVPFLVNSMLKAERFCIAPVCGYRYTISEGNTVVYDDRNTEDLIKSMTEVICIASENGLPKLLERTVKRMDEEYGKFILENYQNGNSHILELLEKAEDSINRDLEGCGELHISLLNRLEE